MAIVGDMHVHSTLSVDGKADMDSMCRAAIEKGLRYVCFTEHFDANPLDTGYRFFDYDRLSQSVDLMRTRYGDRLTVLKGVEFGEPHLYPREFEEIVSKGFDLVLAGVHWVGTHFIGERAHWSNYPLRTVFELYYTEVLAAVRAGGFDVLAHMDLPKRYLGAYCGCEDLVDEILSGLAASGTSLEINTSPLRKGQSTSSPGPDFVRRYVELGGRTVTAGSDAHRCEDVASRWDYVGSVLRRTGDITLVGYQERKAFAI